MAVLGDNGAGKSTLLRALSGTLRAQRAAVTHGSIEFAGRDLVGIEPADIARAGLVQVPEGRRIFGQLTVEENLRAGGLAARDKATRESARARVDELFPILRERRAQRAGLLSGRRAADARDRPRADGEPAVLLLDEPSLGLAPRIVEQVGEVIKEINRQGVTVVLVEQNAAMALAVADRAIVLEVGRVALEGSAEELAASDDVRDRYLGVAAASEPRARRHASAGAREARRRRPDRALRRHHRALGRLVHRRAGRDARADRPQRRRQVDLPERAQRRLPAHRGSVRYGGRELTRLRPHRIAALGVSRTFQNIALSPTASVLDNLLVARHRLMRAGFVADGLRLPRARRERARHEQRVREIATLLGLEQALHRPVGTLSYGTRKRVELARALCAEPGLLLLDEPVAGMVHDESMAMAAGDRVRPRGAEHLGRPGRARHGLRHGHRRPRDGARLRPPDRRRDARGGPARPGRPARLPGRRRA